MSPSRILIVQPGSTARGVRRRFGDYDAWFRRALEGEPIEWTRVRPDLGEALPNPRGFDAVLVTGSPASVASGADWIEEAARWTRHTVEDGMPFLGVCFGHQLLGQAFGAEVRANPMGFEFGTAEIELTEAGRGDALFAALTPPLLFHQTHGDLVASPPQAIRVLARNAHCPVQAIAVGESARGVQFHPESTVEILEALGRETGLTPARLRPAPEGPRLLRAFLQRFVRRQRRL